MPQTAELPDGTRLEFPDGMSQADMSAAIYSNFPHLKPTTQPSVETDPASESREKRVKLVNEMQAARLKGQIAESFGNIAGAMEATAKAITSPIEFVKQAERGVEAAATLTTGSPKELTVKPSEILQRPLAKIPSIPQQQSAAGQIAAGVGNAVIDFANFMQTPEGVAMLGIGALPEGIRRGITATISAQMATHAPEAFNAAVDAAKSGDAQAVAKHTTEFLGGTAMSALAARHSVAPGKTPTEKNDAVMAQVERLKALDAPLTAEAVKQASGEAPKAPVADEIPMVDLEKAPVVPPESVGLPPVETRKASPSVQPTVETKPATQIEPVKSEPVVEPTVTSDKPVVEPKVETPKSAEKAVKQKVEETVEPDIEGLLAVDMPQVAEARARVTEADRVQAELREKARALERESKEIEKEIKPQRGSPYVRSKIKQSAPKAQVERYNEVNRELRQVGAELGAIDERVRKDRQDLEGEADAKVIADTKQSLLRRLDRQARRLDPNIPKPLQQAIDAELKRVILEKYPDATAEEIKRIAPEVRRSVYFQSDPWKAMDAPKLEVIRAAALDAAVNARDVAEHMLSDELKADLDRYRKGGRKYGGPIAPDAPVEPLSGAKLAELKERIQTEADDWRKQDAENRAKEAADKAAREAEEAKLIAEAQQIVSTAKRVGTVGGRTAKEVKGELIERIEDKMEALAKESATTLKKTGEEKGITEYVASSESGGAFGDVSRAGDKYKVTVKSVGGDPITRTVDSLAKAEMLIKAMASTGKGNVIIAVPGDGVFRIRNHGESLVKVWNDANRLSTSSGAATTVSKGAAAEKPPSGIKTESDWADAKEYHGLQPLDEIAGWSPALAELAKKINPDAPEKVTSHDVDTFIKKKKASEAKPEAAKPEEAEHARTEPTADPFERAKTGDEKAFDDLDAQFREVWPDPPELEIRPNRNQVHTPDAFKRLFDEAFKARDFDKVLEAIKATSDKRVWKPYLQELFAAQAKDALAAKKAEWFRHVFSGSRPADAIPPKTPRASTATPTPPRPSSTGGNNPGSGTGARPSGSSGAKPGGSTGPKQPPPPPPSPPPQRIAVEPIKGGGAKSPFKIIEDFENAIGKAIRVRRMKPGGLGTYAPGSTQAARRFASDLDTTAHELAGHWADDKFGIGKPWVNSRQRSPYDSELAKFWIHGSVTPRSSLKYRRAEGIAEYIRAYVVNPAQAMKDAPTFTAYFERTIPPKALNAIQNFSNDVRRWAGEDPLVRAGLNIRMDPPTITERLWNAVRGRGFGFEVSPIDRLRLWFDDPYHYAVKAFGEAVEMRGGLPVKPEHNFELLARLLSGHDARMMNQFENGLVPLKPKQAVNAAGKMDVVRAIDPITNRPMTMEWLLDAFEKTDRKTFDQEMRDASAYMVAERTIEKSKQLGRKDNVSGIGAGIYSDVQAATQLLNRVKAEPARETRLKEAARRYRLWADHNLQMLVDAGRLSKERAKDIRDANEFYVDMHRLSQEFEFSNRQQRGAGAIGTARDLVKKFKGSALEIDNVYRNLLEQTDSIQKEAHRNVTMQAYNDMITNVRELHGADLKEFEMFGAKAKTGDRNTISVFKDGKEQHWKYPPEIHESLKGLGELGTHAFVDILTLIPRFSKYMITHGPQFMARNPMRDTIERTINSRTGSKPWDILQGYTKEELNRYEIFGGGQFGNYIRDHRVWNRELKRVSRELVKDPTTILLSPLKLKRGWEQLAEASEKLGRLAEFRRGFEKGDKELGYDEFNAALYGAGEARGLLDYAKAGTVMRTIMKIIPFSNARIRGLARSLATVKENPKGFAVRWGLAVVVPTVLTMLWNRRDKETWDEYTQMPGYLRDFFWNFKVGNYWLRIPKPHELGVMASGVERAISRAMGEKHAMEGWGKDAAQAALPVGDPVEMTGPLKTFLELEFNRDTFRDRDIVPFHEKDKELEYRKGTKHASGAGQGIAGALNAAGMTLDPRQVDHVLNSLGGLGQLTTDSTAQHGKPLKDTALKGTGYVVEPPISNARDVQWVMDWAKRKGKEQAIKTLLDMRKAVLDEKDVNERARKGKILREKATQMREQIEAIEAK